MHEITESRSNHRMEDDVNRSSNIAAQVFPGQGELARLCRDKDWSATSLGRLEQWPASLRAAASLVLAAPLPMMLLWGPQSIQIYNDAYRPLLSDKHPHSLGQPAAECGSAAYEEDAAAYEAVLRRHESVVVGERCVETLRDGRTQTAFFDFTFSPVAADTAGIGGVLVTATDVSARVQQRHTAAALRESEHRFELMTDAAPSLVWIMSPDGRMEFLNRLWSAHTGIVDRAPAMPDVVNSLVHPDDRADAVQGFAQAARTGSAWEVEHRLRCIGGEYRWFWVHAKPYRDPVSGEIVKWFGTSVDIHDRKLAEQHLKRREEELRTLADNAPVALTRWDRDLRLVFGNQALMQVAQATPKDLLGKRHSEMPNMYPELARELQQAIRAVFETRKPRTAELRVETQLGVQHFIAEYVPEFGADGNVETVLGIARDRTREQSAIEALHEANRRKDEFLATLAHELRNPLAPLRASVQILRLAPADAGRVGKTLDVMDRQLSHMVRLIDDLLDISRITRGKIELQQQVVTVRSVLDGAIEATRPLIESGNHEFVLRLPDRSLRLHADATRLTQVIGNLLNNAAKYTPRGGCIQLSAYRHDKEAVIEVQDNGVGIPGEMLSRIFETFVQVPQNREHSQGGLGIGLSLARQLVEMHGGRIEARSGGAHQGTTFIVRLPLLMDASDETSADPSEAAPLPARVRRVLVVDDNIDAAESLAVMLDLLGHRTAVAFSGAEALRAAREFNPDVIFCDIGMTAMNGYEVARYMRAHDALKHIHLVALTGWGTDDDKQHAAQSGFDLHLTKPVNIEAIQHALRQC